MQVISGQIIWHQRFPVLLYFFATLTYHKRTNAKFYTWIHKSWLEINSPRSSTFEITSVNTRLLNPLLFCLISVLSNADKYEWLSVRTLFSLLYEFFILFRTDRLFKILIKHRTSLWCCLGRKQYNNAFKLSNYSMRTIWLVRMLLKNLKVHYSRFTTIWG